MKTLQFVRTTIEDNRLSGLLRGNNILFYSKTAYEDYVIESDLRVYAFDPNCDFRFIQCAIRQENYGHIIRSIIKQ